MAIINSVISGGGTYPFGLNQTVGSSVSATMPFTEVTTAYPSSNTSKTMKTFTGSESYYKSIALNDAPNETVSGAIATYNINYEFIDTFDESTCPRIPIKTYGIQIISLGQTYAYYNDGYSAVTNNFINQDKRRKISASQFLLYTIFKLYSDGQYYISCSSASNTQLGWRVGFALSTATYTSGLIRQTISPSGLYINNTSSFPYSVDSKMDKTKMNLNYTITSYQADYNTSLVGFASDIIEPIVREDYLQIIS